MMPCDTIVHSHILLAQDENRSILRDHSVAIKDGLICAIAPRTDIVGRYVPDREMETDLVLPGLVNAHAHAAMTFVRGYGDDMPLMDWLTTRIFPIEARLEPDITRLASLLGHAEMLSHGITACMDMYIFEDAVFDAARTAGLRLVGGEAVFAFSSAACRNYHEALEATRRLHERSSSRLRTALNPHSVYTTDSEILAACRRLALELDMPLHIHLAETADECALCEQRTGLRPVAYCQSLGLFDVPATIAHGVHLNKDEIAILADKNVCVAHNPSSNMKLASGIAPVPDMLAAGLDVGLGTDGPASNNQLNIFAEMRQAALLHKISDPTALPAQTVLDMATIHGAACLHWPELGRLRQGGPADLVGMNMRFPNLLPMHNPVSQLVYAAGGHECELTMVEGEVLFHKGKFGRFDIGDVIAETGELLDFVRGK
ncbi:MAG: amidohydrolase [Desulfovibrio sp.]|nr:amidohydrolase [Desulfovibrio sp.]